jgi:lactate dehydrogenase-like 2-hydroxyacid dehydrogenase
MRVEYVDLKTLLKESDFVSLNVPLTEETKHLIGKNELSLMKVHSLSHQYIPGPGD